MSVDNTVSDLDLTEFPKLPTGWCWVALSTFAKIDGGITKDQKRQRTGTMREVPYLRVANVQRGFLDLNDIKTILADDSEIEALRLRKGDILFTEGGDRDKLGRGYVWNEEIEECIHQNHIFRARPVSSIADPKFVSFHGNSFGQKWFSRTGKQTTNLASINKGVLSRFPVPLAPLNEQRRIVAKIEELFSDLDAGVAALKRAKANLKRYRASVLKAAVEGKLTEAWRAEHPDTEPASKLLERILAERRQKWEAEQLAKFAAVGKEPPKNWRDKYVEPSPPDTTGLLELPEGWCWGTLGQLLHRIEGGKSFECLTRPAGPNEWGVVKVSAMTWGTFLEDEQKAIPPAAEFDPTDEIKPNDLLLSRSNTTQLVGATVLVGNCRPRLLLSDKSLRLRPIEIVNLCWLHMALSSSVARSQLSAMATGTSDSMRNVSQDKIKSVVLPLPPLAEQQWIVDGASERLSQIAVAETQIEHGLLRAARLRQSILKQAFEGKLVPQDPTDEPASVLLERLRASRSAHEGNAKAATPARTRGRMVKSQQREGRADE